MRSKNVVKKCIINILVMLPAIGMALTPFSIEDRLNIDFLGYKMFALVPIGIAVILTYNRLSIKDANLWLVIMIIWALISTIINDRDYLLAHYLVGIEFVVGYLFASQILYSEEVITIIKNISLMVFGLVLIQLVSFSLGLGYFSAGQKELDSIEGLLRAGSTIGGPTQTGVVLVIVVGLIVTLTSNDKLNYLYLAAGLAASLMTGTRSAMIVIMVIIFIYLYRETKRNVLFMAIGVTLITIYAYPIIQEMIEEREQLAAMQGFDFTSGRTERWEIALQKLDNSSYGYVMGMGGGTVPINDFQDFHFLSSPHNAYFGILFQYGIPGIIFFMIFLWQKLKKLFRKVTIGSVTLLGSVLVCWNTEVITLSFLYSFFFWLLYFVELERFHPTYLKTNRK